MEKNKVKIKLRFILPLSLAMLVLLATCVITLHQLHNHHINEEVQKSLKEISRLFQTELEEDAELLETIIEILYKDKNLQDAWLAGDRQSLQRYASPIFEDIRSKHKVTHFYFHGLDSVNFLRVHKPQKHGDYIDRLTMNQAAGSGKSAWGIELGPLGTFTLRVVYPWRIDGKLAGYIELGEEIEHIMPELAEIAGAELFFIINKSYLNRAEWEQGMEMLGRTGDWNQFPKFVIGNRSLKQLSPKIHKHLSELLECESAEHLSSMFNVSLGKHRYRVSFLPLIDAGGQDVGDIVVLKDITSLQASLRSLSISLMAICGTVGVLLLVFFYLYTARIEQRLKGAYKGLLTEIEHHKQTKEEVQKQNKFLDNVLESLAYPFLVIDANDYTVKLANSAAKTGSLPENATCYMVSHQRDKPCDGTNDPCPLLEVRKTKKPVTMEHVHFDKDGNSRNIEIHCFPVFDNNGNVSEVIEYFWDITKRKQAEEESFNAHQRLIEQQQHEAELVEAKFTLIRRELVRNTRLAAIGQVSASIAHDLRNPLGAMRNAAYLLNRHLPKDEPKLLDYTDIINQEVAKADQIITNLLEMVGSKSPRKRAVDLGQIIEEVERSRKSEGVACRISVAPDPFVVRADKGQLRQVIDNIFSNSVYAMAGQGSFFVEASRDSDYDTIVLRDTGPGFALQVRERLFEALVTTKASGVGLGLTICRQIIEKHGGTIEADEHSSKGAVIRIRLPRG